MDNRALDKRSVRRTKMVLGLKVCQPAAQAGPLLVHTLDISSSGAKIGSLREPIKLGSQLIVQRRNTRAACRVMWSREMLPGEIQIGIEFLDHSPNFWEFDLDENCAAVWLTASRR